MYVGFAGVRFVYKCVRITWYLFAEALFYLLRLGNWKSLSASYRHITPLNTRKKTRQFPYIYVYVLRVWLNFKSDKGAKECGIYSFILSFIKHFMNNTHQKKPHDEIFNTQQMAKSSQKMWRENEKDMYIYVWEPVSRSALFALKAHHLSLRILLQYLINWYSNSCPLYSHLVSLCVVFFFVLPMKWIY